MKFFFITRTFSSLFSPGGGNEKNNNFSSLHATNELSNCSRTAAGDSK